MAVAQFGLETDVAQNKSNKRKQAKAMARARAIKKQTSAARVRTGGGIAAGMNRAARWPLRDCLVNECWDDERSLAQVLVVRGSPGRVALAHFLVDLQCLGVKNCIARPQMSEREYADFRRTIDSGEQTHVPCEPDLAAAIVQAGLDYAGALGFPPHPAFRLGAPLLNGLDPTLHKDPIACGGGDGKPLYIAGPNDDAPRILAQLRQRLGEGGFHFIAPAGVPGLDSPDDPRGLTHALPTSPPPLGESEPTPAVH